MLEKYLTRVSRQLPLLLLIIFVFRTAYLFVSGLDLIGDESYYWDWSRIPDWCYYSKPPMVAWIIAAATALGGDFTAVVRLPTVLLGTVFLIYFYATTQAFYSRKAAALAVLLVLAMPFQIVANFVMTIDPPLYCFWMMALYYLHQALFAKQSAAWIWAGFATAAALLSKQVALLILLMLLVFLLLDKQRHKQLRRGFLWFLLPVAVSFVPIIWWNSQHNWVMFGHSQSHFGVSATVSLLSQVGQWASFVLYQLLLISPVLFVLVILVSGKACWQLRRLAPQQQFLVLMGPLLLLGILLLGLLQKVQGNWSMPFYFTALILLSGEYVAGRWQKSLKVGLLIGYFMVALTYALPVLIQVFNWHNSVVDPTYRFRHAEEFAALVDGARHRLEAEQGEVFIVVMGHRHWVSQLAFYLPDHPRIYRFDPTGLVNSQYEVWPGPVDAIGKNALIVTEWSPESIPQPLINRFESFQQIGTLANPANKNAHYNLFLGKNLKFWPY
jgi:4-amino-4-deoxy-L-arabinose transferase-like glycosyltransferase